ncbi:MAG: hypothetical protein AB7G13_15255 [Lautropia sp.]
MIRIQRIRYAGGRPAAGSAPSAPAPLGPVGRALAIAGGALLLVAGLFVSAIVFSVVLVVGVVAGGWFWWRTRGLRAELRARLAMLQQMQRRAAGDGIGPGASTMAGASASSQAGRANRGEVIDGDWIRESPDETTARRP